MKALLLLTLVSIGFSAQAEQSAYRVCSSMEDEHDKLKCLEIVRGATRSYPDAILKICEGLERGSYRNRVLAAAKDRLFPAEAAEVCLDFAEDEKIKSLLACVEKAGTVSVKQKKVYSTGDEVYVFNWNRYTEATNAAEKNAASGCKGWPYYAFSDANWKTRSCWASSHAQNYTNFTLGSETRYTRKGTPYTAWVPVAYTATRHYKLYHCRANYYCWKWEKDFSEVQD
ncbi:MAG: hypothetical protein R3B54_06215 [Bdellovibrionota bacterium]